MEWKEARKTEITIGSLFDGIGGFPLAGQRNGMTALWASEIEPFPIKVTKIRFPNMKHLGDITKIDCNNLEPVDIITGGSPCQDLSVAGKRAGLAGARSGLFMEQIRIVRELREIDKRSGRTGEFIRPRFMVWENVPGAFSSNKGEDFRAVLEETARIADETITIPRPPKGKWNTAGYIMGNGYSIAWRVLDAQFWGVPQRRRRIFLVADFGGQSAPEILFKRQGLSRNSQESGEKGQGAAANAERSTFAAGFRGKAGSKSGSVAYQEGVSATLQAEQECHVIAIDSNCQDSRFKLTGGVVPTIPAKAGTGGNNGPMLAVPTVFNEETITSKTNASNPQPGDPCHTLGATGAGRAICIQGSMIGRTDKNGPQGDGINEDVSFTLNTTDRHAVATKVYGICSYASNSMKSDNPHSGIYEAETSRTLDLNGGSPACNQGGMAVVQKINSTPEGISGTVSSKWAKGTGGPAGDECYNLATQPIPINTMCCQGRPSDNGRLGSGIGNPGEPANTLSKAHSHGVAVNYSVRRLTPLECERLQDYPDGWTDIPGASDSGRYKALGNSVAVCCPEYVLEGIKEVLEVAHEK